MRSRLIRAPAKINLYLRIIGRRPDGRHDIETLFQKIDLCDELALEEAEHDSLTVDESPWPIGPPEENLAWRALHALRSASEVSVPPVRITLRKRIPPGGGLGGGSADAAATMRGVNDLFSLGLEDRLLREIGSRLGADVPFLVSDLACAIGRGIGDELEPVEHTCQWPCVVIYPGAPSSTKAAYEAWHRTPRQLEPPPIVNLLTALRDGDLAAAGRSVHSDFTPVLRSQHMGVRGAMDWLEARGFHTVIPTGSGSAVVALGVGPGGFGRASLPPTFSLVTARLLSENSQSEGGRSR